MVSKNKACLQFPTSHIGVTSPPGIHSDDSIMIRGCFLFSSEREARRLISGTVMEEKLLQAA